MNSAISADIRRDLAAASKNAEAAATRAATLTNPDPPMSEDTRRDRELAIGTLLHNAYGAMEMALERLIRAFDGQLPTGANYHADLVRRASTEIPGLRPAILSTETADLLRKLRRFRHAFRHVYDDYDYALAAENVPIAVAAAAGIAEDLARFLGVPEPGAPPA